MPKGITGSCVIRRIRRRSFSGTRVSIAGGAIGRPAVLPTGSSGAVVRAAPDPAGAQVGSRARAAPRPWNPRRGTRGARATLLLARARIASRQRRASPAVSFMPARRGTGLFGLHKPPPEHDVVPPRYSACSTTSASSPCAPALSAVTSPAAPDPATSASTSPSNLPSTSIAVGSRRPRSHAEPYAAPEGCWLRCPHRRVPRTQTLRCRPGQWSRRAASRVRRPAGRPVALATARVRPARLRGGGRRLGDASRGNARSALAPRGRPEGRARVR